MDGLQVTLRLLHVGLGVFWAGTVLFLGVFLGPAIRDSGPEGGKVMAALAARRVPTIMPILAVITIISGLWMYYRDSAGFNSVYMKSPTGMTFGLGGLAAILALVLGGAVLGPTMEKISELSKAPPPADNGAADARAAELQRLRARFGSGTNVVAALVAVTVIAMAIARYV